MTIEQISNSQLRLWLVRAPLFSFPASFFVAMVYCLLNKVPNPHSDVPRWTICLLAGFAMIFNILKIDRLLWQAKTTEKSRDRALIWIPVGTGIVWLAVFALAHFQVISLIPSGHTWFVVLWLITSVMSWSLERNKTAQSGAAQ